MRIDSNRRGFIKGSATFGIAAMIAGCTGQDPDDDDDNGRENGDPPDDGTPEPDVEYEPLPTYNYHTLPRSDDAEGYEWAVMARQQLEVLGFDFDWEVLESSTWADRLFARDWDFNHLTWFGTIERVYPYYNLFYSFHSQFATEAGGNFQMWESEEYDEAVENFIEAQELEEQQQWANRCQEILALNQPVIFGLHEDTLSAANTDQFTNWNGMLDWNVYWNVNSLRDIEAVGDAEEVVFGTPIEQENYPNFFAVTGNSLETHKMSYDTPLAYDYDGELYGLAAEDWEFVDETTIDVTLRDGMTWHDGEDVTAEDLKFTWDAIQEYPVPYIESDVEPYESSELLDDLTVRFNLSRPFGGFTRISLFRVPILPRHVWDGVTEREGLEHPGEWTDPDMTGSGPFEFVSYEPGDRIVYQKNPDHRFADDIDFETLVYRVYGAEATLTGDLIDGQVTFAQRMGPTHWDRANDAPNVEATAEPSIAANGVWCRCDMAPFNDVRVRQALAHAINIQEVIDIIYRGRGERAVSPVAPANEAFYNEDVARYDYDLDRARELLMEAGLRWDDDGRLMMPVDWEPEVEYISPDD